MNDVTVDIITVNGEQRRWSTQRVSALLADSGIDRGRGGIAIAINGEVVPRAEWDQTPIEPNDHIEIVQIVRGG